MTAVLWALNALRKLPAWAYGAVAGVAVCVALWMAHRSAVGSAYERGKRDASQGVVFDSVMIARAAEVVAIRAAHTDTVVRTVTRTVRRLDTLILRVPDSLRTVPEVVAVVEGARDVSAGFDSLVTVVTVERAAWTERARVDSANSYALRVIATARGDTIVQLKKRPTWKKAVGMAGAVGVAAFLGARR